jgi:DNA-binding NarL/FixJ family response regulator
MLEGLVSVFEGNADFAIKSCAKDGDSALSAIQQFEPDIIVLELGLGKKHGLILIQEIQDHGLKTVPIVFTGAPIQEVMRAIDMGIQGLVSKDKSKQILTRCIKTVYDGHTWLDKDLTMKTVRHLLDREKNDTTKGSGLTSRELAVAKMVSEGWPNKKIAAKLFISEGTVKLHLHHVYQKLNCTSRVALVLCMQENGWI